MRPWAEEREEELRKQERPIMIATHNELGIAIGLGLCVLGAMISVTALICIVRSLWLKHKENKERRKR